MLARILALFTSTSRLALLCALTACLVAREPTHVALAAPAVADCPSTEVQLNADVVAASAGGTVAFDCASPTTIAFDATHGGSGAPIAVSGAVTLDANSSAAVTLDGGGQVPFFVVTGMLTLKSLTLTNGLGQTGGAIDNEAGTVMLIGAHLVSNATAPYIFSGSSGGAVYNTGTLDVTDSVLEQNQAQHGGEDAGGGGAISNSGIMTITNSVISNNSAFSDSAGSASCGGGISTSGSATITNTTIVDNTAVNAGTVYGRGGGICNGGTLTLTRSLLDGNATSASAGVDYRGSGGAIYSAGSAALVTIHDSTLTNNKSATGAAIYNTAALTVTGSTIAGNAATGGDGGALWGTGQFTNSTLVDNSAHYGAAVYSTSGTSVTASTITGNTTDAQPGGAIVGHVTLGATIIGNNSGGNCTITNSFITSAGYNLTDDATCHLGASTDRQSVNVLVDALANNGGPTKTVALGPGSPAIDVIPTSSCQSVDQRGYTRSDDGESACDVGAFESGATSAITAACVTRFDVARAGHSLVFRWRVSPTRSLAGFELYAGHRLLTPHIIPAHRSHAYIRRVRDFVRGTYRLRVLSVTGHEEVYVARRP